MENKPESSVRMLLEEIHHTLKTIQHHKGAIKITPELNADIEKFAANTVQLKERAEGILNSLDVETKMLEENTLTNSNLRTSDKQLLKFAQEMEIEAYVMQQGLKKGASLKGKHSSKESKENDRQKIKERKKLFKTIGGDQKWIPL